MPARRVHRRATIDAVECEASMKINNRAKFLVAASVAALAVGIGIGASVPSRSVSAAAADPQLAGMLGARSPGERLGAALSTKQPVVHQAAYSPAKAPSFQSLSERTPAVRLAYVEPGVAVLPSSAIAPAVLGPSPVPATAFAAAAPVSAIPLVPALAGGASPLLGAVALVPIIPAVLGGGGGGVGNQAVAPAVPEPATWLMMIAGFGMLGFALRRRRRQLRSAVGIGARPAFMDVSAPARAG